MVEGRTKSRSMRRVRVKLPGNKSVIHYRKRKPEKAKCSCGAVLHGVVRERPFKLRKILKVMKRPERPYAGVLCSRCMRKKIKESIK